MQFAKQSQWAPVFQSAQMGKAWNTLIVCAECGYFDLNSMPMAKSMSKCRRTAWQPLHNSWKKNKTRMPMCKSWKNLKGRQRHTTSQAATAATTQKQKTKKRKKKLDKKWKRICAQLLQKTKIRGAKQSCVKCVCVDLCVCACVWVRRKPLDKNVQLQRAARTGYAHCCHCPKVDTMWAVLVSCSDFYTLNSARIQLLRQRQ